MPNIKSQIKRDRTNEEARAKNAALKSELRTAVKKVEALVSEGKKEEAVVAFRDATALLDRYSQKGVISVNSANRKKSHLAKLVA